jgi:chromosome segregation ATPase
MMITPELFFLAAAEVAKKPEGMTFERWLTLFGFLLSVTLGVVTLMKFLKERRDAKDVKNVAEMKAPAEKDVIIVTGAHSAVLMMEQAAKAAREEADRKQIELDKALTKNADLEEKLRVKDEKIDVLEAQIVRIQQELNSVNIQLQSLRSQSE